MLVLLPPGYPTESRRSSRSRAIAGGNKPAMRAASEFVIWRQVVRRREQALASARLPAFHGRKQITKVLQPTVHTAVSAPFLPPLTPSSWASKSSIEPAGFSGSVARSSSLKLSRYASSFQARMTCSRFMMVRSFSRLVVFAVSTTGCCSLSSARGCDRVPQQAACPLPLQPRRHGAEDRPQPVSNDNFCAPRSPPSRARHSFACAS